ncbi:hypothetical protein ACFPA8_03805 [Streptomyces ovatisporus]|uniref:Secreted protein n=1 Tax=Streptomyces ovatisporus TaxID=1128682 RepID=A0ABV9A3P1_9ACTN
MQSGETFGSAAKAIAATVVVLAVTGSAALSVASAQDDKAGASGRGTAKSVARHAAGPPVGLWRMDGYGTVLSVDGERVQEYRITNVSCIRRSSAERVGGGHGRTARYVTEDGTAFTLNAAAGTRNRASMRREDWPGHRGLRRIGSLPDGCGRTVGGPVATSEP